jgi:hypothetical protein
MSFRAKKNILNTIGAFSLISWVAFIYLYYFYFQNVAPRTPNLALGQIYKINNHGYIFYLTEKQKIVAFIPLIFAIFSIIIDAILEWRWKIYRKLYGKGSGTSWGRT